MLLSRNTRWSVKPWIRRLIPDLGNRIPRIDPHSPWNSWRQTRWSCPPSDLRLCAKSSGHCRHCSLRPSPLCHWSSKDQGCINILVLKKKQHFTNLQAVKWRSCSKSPLITSAQTKSPWAMWSDGKFCCCNVCGAVVVLHTGSLTCCYESWTRIWFTFCGTCSACELGRQSMSSPVDIALVPLNFNLG